MQMVEEANTLQIWGINYLPLWIWSSYSFTCASMAVMFVMVLISAFQYSYNVWLLLKTNFVLYPKNNLLRLCAENTKTCSVWWITFKSNRLADCIKVSRLRTKCLYQGCHLAPILVDIFGNIISSQCLDGFIISTYTWLTWFYLWMKITQLTSLLSFLLKCFFFFSDQLQDIWLSHHKWALTLWPLYTDLKRRMTLSLNLTGFCDRPHSSKSLFFQSP